MRLPGRRCPPPTRGIVSTPASSSNEQIRRPPSPLARTLGRLRRSSAPPPGRERPQRRPGRLVCAAPIIMAVVRLLPRSVPHSRSGPRTRASACGTGRSYSTRRVFLGHADDCALSLSPPRARRWPRAARPGAISPHIYRQVCPNTRGGCSRPTTAPGRTRRRGGPPRGRAASVTSGRAPSPPPPPPPADRPGRVVGVEVEQGVTLDRDPESTRPRVNAPPDAGGDGREGDHRRSPDGRNASESTKLERRPGPPDAERSLSRTRYQILR